MRWSLLCFDCKSDSNVNSPSPTLKDSQASIMKSVLPWEEGIKPAHHISHHLILLSLYYRWGTGVEEYCLFLWGVYCQTKVALKYTLTLFCWIVQLTAQS